MKITNRRRKWARDRSATLVGKKLAYPAACSDRYAQAMQKEIKLMIRDYEREVKKLSRESGTMDASLSSQVRIMMNKLSGKWAKRFSSAAAGLAERFTSSVNKFADGNLRESLKQLTGGYTLNPPELTPDLEEKVKAATAYNVSLIKSIPEQFHEKIEGFALRSLTGGDGMKGLYDEILKVGGVTEKRAKFIAEDQTSKITTAFNTERMKSVGIKKLRWLHSGGSAEPRELHLKLDGQVFDIDSPPVIDERTGQRGWGGEVPNCKCTVVPVIEFD